MLGGVSFSFYNVGKLIYEGFIDICGILNKKIRIIFLCVLRNLHWCLGRVGRITKFAFQ